MGTLPKKHSRLVVLDALRGVIMSLMALDHVAWFALDTRIEDPMWGGPFPLPSTFWRFVAHLLPRFSTPGFFFLMGTSMALLSNARQMKGWTETRVLHFFLLRGSLLILLQFTLENAVWIGGTEGAYDNWLYFGVLVALGSSMILMTPLLRFGPRTLAGVGFALLLVFPFLIPDAAEFERAVPVWQRILFLPGHSTGSVDVYFTLFPWVAVGILGMAFGKLLIQDSAKWIGRVGWIGLLSFGAFVAFRLYGGRYGNLRVFEVASVYDFFRLVKYPPSWTLLTLAFSGIFFALWGLSRSKPSYLSTLGILGRVPLFFYFFHLYFLATFKLCLLPQDGVPLPGVYLIWFFTLFVAYPFCAKYEKFKFRHSEGSLWRLP